MVYASPLVLKTFQSGNSSQRKAETKQFYTPFKEDVYSLGLTLLHMALLCSSQQVKDLRENSNLLQAAVRETLP